MEEEGIGLVLAKATELRLKISNCIHKSNDPLPTKENGVQVDEEEDEEAQRLFNICDAFEALENQLGSLQVRIPKTPIFICIFASNVFCIFLFIKKP